MYVSTKLCSMQEQLLSVYTLSKNLYNLVPHFRSIKRSVNLIGHNTKFLLGLKLNIHQDMSYSVYVYASTKQP